MNPCRLCGITEPNAPCLGHGAGKDHAASQCNEWNASQQITKMEMAWALMKAKKDAPNYRKATGSKKCGNCKAWDSSKTDDPMTGYCKWYDFNCRADHVCDAWAGE